MLDPEEEAALLEVLAPQKDLYFSPKDNQGSFHRNRGGPWNSSRGFRSEERPPYWKGSDRFGGRSNESSSNGNSSFVIPVHSVYICHLCGEKGHHINNCQKGSDPKKQKKIKPSTGIPRSWLRKISRNEIPDYSDVFLLPDGDYAVIKTEDFIASASSDVFFSKSTASRIKNLFGNDLSNQTTKSLENFLTCSLCSFIFDSPVVVPCCGDTFCRSCWEAHFSVLSQPVSDGDESQETSQDDVDGVLSQSTFLSSYKLPLQAPLDAQPPLSNYHFKGLTECNLPPDLLAFASDFDVEKPLPAPVEKLEPKNQNQTQNMKYIHAMNGAVNGADFQAIQDMKLERNYEVVVHGQRKRAAKEMSVKVEQDESIKRTGLCPSCSSVVASGGFVQNESMALLVHDLYRVC